MRWSKFGGPVVTEPTHIDVSHESVSARIYRTPHGNRQRFTVVYRFAGKRHRKKFNNLPDAEAFALDECKKISRGKTTLIGYTAAETASFARCAEIAKPTGVALELLVAECVEAKAILGNVPLRIAALDYKRRNPNATATLVPDAVREFIETKSSRDADYHRNLKARLELFGDAFKCSLSSVTGAAVSDWLGKLKVKSDRTRSNYLQDIRALFRWAKRRKFLPVDFDEIENIETPEYGPGKIQPFTPEELEKVLRYAQKKKKRFLPYLAIRAFSGIRFKEMGRIRPEHFHKTGWISMDADITKTHQRRLIPILPILKAWLKRYPIKGPQSLQPAPLGSLAPRLVELVVGAGVANRRNGLRDSFASYRMAVVRDAGKVSQETGHSIDVLRRSYREIRMPDGRVITPTQGRRWFSIRPNLSPLRHHKSKHSKRLRK